MQRREAVRAGCESHKTTIPYSWRSPGGAHVRGVREISDRPADEESVQPALDALLQTVQTVSGALRLYRSPRDDKGRCRIRSEQDRTAKHHALSLPSFSQKRIQSCHQEDGVPVAGAARKTDRDLPTRLPVVRLLDEL